jgi:glycosyltransferase involved in cell wall biosynthesis
MDTLRHMSQVWKACRDHRPDVVHSFGRLAYLLPILPKPMLKVQSYQRAVSRRSVVWGRRLARGTLLFTACSADCARTAGDGGEWHPIFNGAPADLFTPTKTAPPEAPLVFLGRLERIKGPHTAIRVARASGRKLVLAGNIPSLPGAQAFFDTEIAPHLDGEKIAYVGPVNDEQKNRLLGQAAALLMPIEWREPFGIVMAEALACGTPVLGFPLGSVPEVVQDGVNGFLCSNVEEMVEAVGKIGSLSRAACRRDFEERFSDRVLVTQYEGLYRDGLERISKGFSMG